MYLLLVIVNRRVVAAVGHVVEHGVDRRLTNWIENVEWIGKKKIKQSNQLQSLSGADAIDAMNVSQLLEQTRPLCTH